MPKVVLITQYADAKSTGWPGDVIEVSRKEAKDLVDGGSARYANAADRAFEFEEAAAPGPAETATAGPVETATSGPEATATLTPEEEAAAAAAAAAEPAPSEPAKKTTAKKTSSRRGTSRPVSGT